MTVQDPDATAKKTLIERAHLMGEKLGLAMWNEDEAGPYQTVPCAGLSWQPEGEPAKEPHEYLRNGTAKLVTLFHPATGEARIRGVTSCTNAVLHSWLKEEVSAIVKTLPEPQKPLGAEENRQVWASWREGLTVRVTLPAQRPPLRMLLSLSTISSDTRRPNCCSGSSVRVSSRYAPR